MIWLKHSESTLFVFNCRNYTGKERHRERKEIFEPDSFLERSNFSKVNTLFASLFVYTKRLDSLPKWKRLHMFILTFIISIRLSKEAILCNTFPLRKICSTFNLKTSINDFYEFRFQRSSSDKETIYVWLRSQFLAIFGSDRTTIDDSQGISHFLTQFLWSPFTNGYVDFFGLSCSGYFTGSNGPNWFVGYDDVAFEDQREEKVIREWEGKDRSEREQDYGQRREERKGTKSNQLSTIKMKKRVSLLSSRRKRDQTREWRVSNKKFSRPIISEPDGSSNWLLPHSSVNAMGSISRITSNWTSCESYNPSIYLSWSTHLQSETSLATASNCLTTTFTVSSASLSCKLSPTQRMTFKPSFKAAPVFSATFSSFSENRDLLSEWPKMTQGMFASFNWETEISPVKAPEGLW